MTRKQGGWRQTATQKKDATIEQELIQRVEPETGGDLEDRCKYTRSRLRSLAKRLGRGSATTRGRLLKPLGYRPFLFLYITSHHSKFFRVP